MLSAFIPSLHRDTETIVDGMAHARVCIPVEEDFSRAFVLKHKVKLLDRKSVV